MTDTLAANQSENHQDIGPHYSAEQISAYYLELEQLLDRVARGLTHYQILGLERLATTGEIKLAYLRAMALLNPSYFGIGLSVPASLLGGIDKAFEQVSRAYSVLVNFDRRVEYDNLLAGGVSARLPVGCSHLLDTDASSEPDHHQPAINDASLREESAEAVSPVEDNRRRSERFNLTIPASAVGYDSAAGKWVEITQTLDVSEMGISLRLRHAVRHGMVLQLTMPLPIKLRAHGFSDSTYNVYALVRHIEPTTEGRRIVGLEFIGERPPVGYLNKPWAIFRAGTWTTGERRREPRRRRSEAVGIEYLNASMQAIKQEIAFVEDISPGGARVYIKSAPQQFDFVKVSSANRNFESLASVRNRYVGNDGFERLCLRFLNNKWAAPLEDSRSEG